MRAINRVLPVSRALLLIVLCLGLIRFEGSSFASTPEPRPVTLTLAAIDDISGVYMMQIAEDIANPPAAVPYAVSYTLTTAATILYIRVDDRAQNWSPWVAITIGGAPVVNQSTYPTPTPTAIGTPTPTPNPGGGGGGGFFPPPVVTSPSPSVSGSPTPSESPSVSPTPSPTPTVTVSPAPLPTIQVIVPTPTISPTPSPTHVIVPPLVQPTLQVSASVRKQLSTSTLITLPTVVSDSIKKFILPSTQATTFATSSKVGQAISLLVPSQPKGTVVSFSFIGLGNKAILLVSTTLKSAGQVDLPVLSFKIPGKYKLLVKIGRISKTITVTVKK
jgi:hypothetical protein